MILKVGKIKETIFMNNIISTACSNFLDDPFTGVTSDKEFICNIGFNSDCTVCEFCVYLQVKAFNSDYGSGDPKVFPLFLKCKIRGICDENSETIDQFELQDYYVIKEFPVKTDDFILLDHDITF